VREIALERFFRIPQAEHEREHDLRPDEIVIEVVVPPASAGIKVASYEVRQKAAFDWPLAMASAALDLDGGAVKRARVVLGHVAPVPWISPEAAVELTGKTITPEVAAAAATAALAPAQPLSRNKYKITLAKAAVKRAILQAAGTSTGGAA
jgi:xanthine dehydrogenase YagS FAD-binding subunit